MKFIVTTEIPTPPGAMPISNTFEVEATSYPEADKKARLETNYDICTISMAPLTHITKINAIKKRKVVQEIKDIIERFFLSSL